MSAESEFHPLIEAARAMAARGWLPATSGNLSCRLGDGRIAITASGVDKTALRPADLVTLELDRPPPPGASAETALHLEAYRRDAESGPKIAPEIGAVLHGHSIHATVLSRLLAAEGAVELAGYELLKAFAGIKTHDTRIKVAILANDQDMTALAARAKALAPEFLAAPGYLIAGHGLYAWGRDAASALRHFEAFEFLFGCELTAMRFGR